MIQDSILQGRHESVSQDEISTASRWLSQGRRRQRVLSTLKQPMTATQLSQQTGLNRDCCSYVLAELAGHDLVYCINYEARRSRLYWLTGLGKRCQDLLRAQQHVSNVRNELANVDYHLFGWVCFSHRAAVLKCLVEPMQPSRIKRVARRQNPHLKMSANNVRDVIRLFEDKGIVRSLPGKRRAHPRYELTTLGDALRTLLLRAEQVWEAGSDHWEDHIHKGDTSM